MRLVFDGLEKVIDIESGCPVVLQVENQALFSRLIQAMAAQEGRYAVEPYSVWDDESEIAPKMATLLISDVFDLPWSDRSLLGEVLKRIEKDLIDDEEARLDLEKAEHLLASRLMSLSAGLSADYTAFCGLFYSDETARFVLSHCNERHGSKRKNFQSA